MNRFRPFVLSAVAIISALLAYGFLTRPAAKGIDSEGFSAARVAQDIEVISKKHHSVAQPQERAEVREYLVSRLKELGADTVRLFEYDSLTGPQNKHVVYTFDAVNILAEFAPVAATAPATPQKPATPALPSASSPDKPTVLTEPSGTHIDTNTCLLLVAHYDSRYSQPMPGNDTVWSYGAADDGYGLGVILETVSQTLRYRNDWQQGIKVLFTDAEEVGMMGMKAAWDNDRHLFEDVGLMINLEARGPYSPALLFETCPGNSKVMDLYASAAGYPFTYSLTTVVYTFMPNFTDFTVVKDEIPGLNFSTIADINHYHTDLDRFDNISEKSIQHYGAQIVPIVREYLTNPAYTDRNFLKSTEDTVNFTIPALGLLNFSKTAYTILNIIIFLLFLSAFAFEVIRGRLKAADALKTSLTVLGAGIGILALGEAVAYICAAVAGAKFSFFGIVQGVRFDNAAMTAVTAAMALATTAVYLAARRKAMRRTSGSMRQNAAATAAAKHAAKVLYGTIFLMFVLSAVLLASIGENLMFFIPLTCATAAMMLYRSTSLKLWLPAAMALILLHAFSFLHALAMALTLGAFGAVAMLAFFDLMVLIPLADLYLTDTGSRR